MLPVVNLSDFLLYKISPKTRSHSTANNLCLHDLSRRASDWRKSTITSPCVQPSFRGRRAGSFPEQRLVIEPSIYNAICKSQIIERVGGGLYICSGRGKAGERGGLYTCQLFLRQSHEIFILMSVRVSEDDPTISEDNFSEFSEDVPKNSKVLKFHDTLGIICLKKNNLLGFFPSKSVNLGLKCDLHGLFLSQIGSSFHFSVVNGPSKANKSRL